jgi:nucleoside-diphosphate-sugar epimerase
VVGTLNVLNAAREARVKRIVYASSSSVYGDLETLPTINDLLNTQIEAEYRAPRPGDIQHSLANIGKAQQFLGYQATIDFK